MARTATNKLLEMVENGELDKDAVIQACLEYMNEEDVKEMMLSNDFGDVEDSFIDDYGTDYDDDRDAYSDSDEDY